MNTGIEHELRAAVEHRCRPNIDDIDARELLEYLDRMRKALQELELACDARAGLLTSAAYLACDEIAGMRDANIRLDDARRVARALLPNA